MSSPHPPALQPSAVQPSAVPPPGWLPSAGRSAGGWPGWPAWWNTTSAPSRKDATESRCDAEMSGPICVDSRRGSPTCHPATAGSSSSRNRS